MNHDIKKKGSYGVFASVNIIQGNMYKKNTETHITEEEKVLWALNKRICNNLHSLLLADGVSYSEVIRKLNERDGFTITASYFNKLLLHPDKYKVPVVFLLQCADFFHISIDDLIRKDLDPLMKYDSDGMFSSLLNEYKEYHSSDIIPKADTSSSAFISDPNNILFKSILHTYYCYFYPTASRENMSADSILQGSLEFKKDGEQCKVVFTVRANINDTAKKPIEKVYEGYSVISTTVQNLYCILKCEDIGEYCFLIFRYFHFNYEYQDCHMAEMLCTSSAKRERYPTALRIFLSKEPLKQEHIKFIAPHLCLNYSQITINSEKLSMLQDVSEQYRTIIERLTQKVSSENMIIFKEKEIVRIAQDFLDEDATLKFITDLRSASYAFHYNKVSDTVNDNIHGLLLSLGYYQT